jgi:hypothetical protein
MGLVHSKWHAIALCAEVCGWYIPEPEMKYSGDYSGRLYTASNNPLEQVRARERQCAFQVL